MILLDRAYSNFRKFMKLPRNHNSFLIFVEFIGAKYYCGKLEIDQRSHDRLKWLGGPDAETIYKIYKAQRFPHE